MTPGTLAATRYLQEITTVSGYASIWKWLCQHPCFQQIYSREMPGKFASNSEKRRWIVNRSLLINGRTDWKPDDPLPTELFEIVLFPKGSTRTTFL